MVAGVSGSTRVRSLFVGVFPSVIVMCMCQSNGQCNVELFYYCILIVVGQGPTNYFV